MSLRDNLGELKVPLTWTAAVVLVVAAVAAIAFIVSDRRETFQAEAYGATRNVSDRVLAPVGDVLSTPGRWIGTGVDNVSDYFFAGSQNRELKAELKEMRQWRDVAIALRDTNERYQALLGLKTDPPIPMVAARVVTDSRGPFANSRLANAGRERGIQSGNPVMSENGLVGRIVGVSDGVSRVLLLTDIAARTPVMIDRTNARAILTGDGGLNPRLDYMRGKDPVREGDRVLTSGDGGVLPRGLPVGVAVKGLDGRWRVVLASDAAPVDYVRILLFRDFTQVANRVELGHMSAPPPTEGAPTLAVAGETPASAASKPSPAPASAAKPAEETSRTGEEASKPAPSKPSGPKSIESNAKPTASKLAAPNPIAPKPTAPKPSAPKSAAAKPASAGIAP